jgi:hypothetical protein
VTGGLRELYKGELRNFYSSPSIIRMIESRRMRWAWHVARIGVKRNAHRRLVGKPGGKNHSEDRDVGEWIILKWILLRYAGVVWNGFIWLKRGISGGLLRTR